VKPSVTPWRGRACERRPTARVGGSCGKRPGCVRPGKVDASSTFFICGQWVYRDIPEDLRAGIEPVIESHGLELVDAVLLRGRGPWSLRVIVDTLVGDGMVSIEHCAAVSREIGAQLDAADLIPVRYRLEVSSPGLDRRLAREKDFTAACGKEVYLETRTPIEGRRRFRGRLLRLEEEMVGLEVEGRETAIPFAEVAQANIIYQFTREDFARDKRSRHPLRREAKGSSSLSAREPLVGEEDSLPRWSSDRKNK